MGTAHRTISHATVRQHDPSFVSTLRRPRDSIRLDTIRASQSQCRNHSSAVTASPASLQHHRHSIVTVAIAASRAAPPPARPAPAQLPSPPGSQGVSDDNRRAIVTEQGSPPVAASQSQHRHTSTLSSRTCFLAAFLAAFCNLIRFVSASFFCLLASFACEVHGERTGQEHLPQARPTKLRVTCALANVAAAV